MHAMLGHTVTELQGGRCLELGVSYSHILIVYSVFRNLIFWLEHFCPDLILDVNRHFPLSGECEGSCSTPDLLFAQICLFELQSGDQSMPINILVVISSPAPENELSYPLGVAWRGGEPMIL